MALVGHIPRYSSTTIATLALHNVLNTVVMIFILHILSLDISQFKTLSKFVIVNIPNYDDFTACNFDRRKESNGRVCLYSSVLSLSALPN